MNVTKARRRKEMRNRASKSPARERWLPTMSQKLGMQFDNGNVVAFSGQGLITALQSAAPAALDDEYEVRPSGWPEPIEGEVVAESFEYETQDSIGDSNAKPQIEGASIEEEEEEIQAANPIEIEQEGSPAQGNNEATTPSNNAASPQEDTETEELLSEEDIQNDIRALLASPGKLAPGTSNSATPTNRRQQLQQNQQAQQQNQSAPAQTEQKNEDRHAIFDQLAESMRYANAYDLGILELEKRFDAFDEEDLIEEQNAAESSERQDEAPAPVPRAEVQPSTEEFLTDLDEIAVQHNLSVSKTEEIPLDPGVGGRSIGADVLEPGDVILSTTTENISRSIRVATGSEVSHAAMYIGNNQVIEAIGDGVIVRDIQMALADDSLAVAYRHRDMTPERAQSIVDFATRMARERRSYDAFGLLRVAPRQLARTICNRLDGSNRDQCLAQIDRLRVGTDRNDNFFCSQLVLEAYRQAGLTLTDVEPDWSSPDEILDLHYNGTLEYVGHLIA